MAELKSSVMATALPSYEFWMKEVWFGKGGTRHKSMDKILQEAEDAIAGWANDG